MNEIELLIQKKNEYEKLKEKLASLNKTAAKVDEINKQNQGLFEDLKKDIIATNAKLAPTMKSLCAISDYLSISQGQILFNDSTVPSLEYNEETCFSVYEKVKKEFIKSATLIIKGENISNASKVVAISYQTILDIYKDIDGMEKSSGNKKLQDKKEEIKKVEKEISSFEKKYPNIDEQILQAFDVYKKAKEESFSITEYLQQEEAGTVEYSNSILFGRYMSDISSVVLEYAKKNFKMSRTEFPSTPLLLKSESESNAIFCDVDDNYINKDDDFFDNLSFLIYNSMFEFAPNNYQLAFVESNLVTPILDPICRTIQTEISADYIYKSLAKDKNEATDLMKQLVAELKSRQSNYRTFRSVHGRACRSIEEYNSYNQDNPMKYILLIISGYPDIFIDSELRKSLNILISEGGAAGIMTLVFGHNIEIKEKFSGNTDKLDLESLRMKEVFIANDGSGIYDKMPLNMKCYDTSIQLNELLSILKKRLEGANKFFLNSIAQRSAEKPFYNQISIPLGNTEGKTYYLNTATEKPPYPFTLITGGTGSGKSAFLHTLIMSGALKYSPDELEYHIIDFKTKDDSREFKDYEYHKGVENLYIPHVKYLSLQSRAENALDAISYIKNLMNKRNKLGKFKEYNSRPEVLSGKLKPMPQIYVLIDEYENMLAGGDDSSSNDFESKLIGQRIVEGITTILKRARTFGIGIIFSGQAAKLPKDAMNQISNRIAFKNGNNVFVDMFDTNWRENMLNKFPAEEFRGYAYCSEGASIAPKFVRMSFSGETTSRRMKEFAKEIREKYGKRPVDQVVIGGTGSAVLDKSDAYRTWQEDHEYRIEMAKLNFESEKEFLSSGLQDEIKKFRPLSIGISASSSLSIDLEYSKDANGHNYFAFATEAELCRIEGNAAFAFLYQTADLTYTKPRIILCDGSDGKNAEKKMFKSFMQKSPYLQSCIEVITNKEEIARRILKLEAAKKENAISEPIFLILHEVEWLNPNRSIDWLPKVKNQPKQEAAATKENNAYQQKLEQMKEKGLKVPAFMANINTSNLKSAAETKENDKFGYFTISDVKNALKELYLYGNRNEIFVLASSVKYENISQVILSMSNDQQTQASMSDYAVYGSYEMMKNKSANVSNVNANVCYVRPTCVTTRLYDYESKEADKWWDSLTKRLEKAR